MRKSILSLFNRQCHYLFSAHLNAWMILAKKILRVIHFSDHGVVGQVWVLGGFDMFLYLICPDALDLDV